MLGYVVHASPMNAWSLIRYEGLKRGRRGHIHFVRRAPQADEVVAGVRRGGEVCIFVDVQRAIEDGIPFFITLSKVLVSPGNEEGVIPVKYIAKVVVCSSGMQLFPLSDPEVHHALSGKHVVGVNSLHAMDDEFAYFTWAQFRSLAQDVMMLFDKGASISF